MRTEAEPKPFIQARREIAPLPDWPLVTSWAGHARGLGGSFSDVLDARRSSVGGSVDESDVAALLVNAMRLRFRRDDGRFGAWESRSTPSAGGMSALRLLVLPIEADGRAGIYDDARHGLIAGPQLTPACDLNARSVRALTGAAAGTTIQLIADRTSYVSCYHNPDTLLWRDAGALCATVSLIATSLTLSSVILGRIGHDVVEATRLPRNWTAAGAVHIGRTETATS